MREKMLVASLPSPTPSVKLYYIQSFNASKRTPRINFATLLHFSALGTLIGIRSDRQSSLLPTFSKNVAT